MIRIICDTEEEKRQLINESKYIHDFVIETGCFTKKYIGLDSDKASTLMHIYNSDIIEINNKK